MYQTTADVILDTSENILELKSAYVRDPHTARVGKEILPFEMGDDLPEYFQRKAEVQLNSTLERRKQGLQKIKELCIKDQLMKYLEFDDDFLLQYLKVRKFDVPSAFLKLKGYVILRKKNPQMFTNLRFESIVRSQTDKTITVLPRRCQDGCTIMLIQLNNWDPDEFNLEEVKRGFVVYLLQSLREPMSQVNGLKIIIDVTSNPLRHLKHCTPNNMYLVYHGIQECVPIRYKEIHVVNDSLAFKAAWFIIKQFSSEKMKRRVHFHATSKTLADFFPLACLPKEFGGELESYDMSNWLKKVMTPEQLATIGGTMRVSEHSNIS